jgi:PhnB protein
MIQLEPYLTFDGNCRDAMAYYQQCFGGELTMQTVADTPIAAQCPAGMQQHIMHSMLKNDDFTIMATDMQGPDGYKPGNTIALSLNFDEEAKARAYYDMLKAGGNVIDELSKKFWGALFGVVQDKFGMVWMLNCQLPNN